MQTVCYRLLEIALSIVYSVKQLTDGCYCITKWHRSGFTWPFPPGEQKKLKRTTLHQRVGRPSTVPRRARGENKGEWPTFVGIIVEE
jgi:hypothetical protein